MRLLVGIAGYIYLFTILEASVGLICACFPVIWPLIKKFIDKGGSLVSQQSLARGDRSRGSNVEQSQRDNQRPLSNEIALYGFTELELVETPIRQGQK